MCSIIISRLPVLRIHHYAKDDLESTHSVINIASSIRRKRQDSAGTSFELFTLLFAKKNSQVCIFFLLNFGHQVPNEAQFVMKKSFHGKLWCFGSDMLVETLAFRAAAFDAFVFVPGEAATDHGVFSSQELAK